MATSVTLLPNARQQFINGNGQPIVGGTVGTYIPGTLTPKTTYQDSTGTTANTNPITLDALGSAVIWGSGAYREIVKDSSGNVVWDNTTLSGGVTHEFAYNILDYGADPTGVSDSTSAIQAAMTAAGSGGTVECPTGTYLLSATLNMPANMWLIGAGPNSTIFRRFTDYGNTIYCANIGAGRISGIWFYHSYLPATTDTSLQNLATSGAHVYVNSGQGFTIDNCWMWRMPYGIRVEQSASFLIDNTRMQGVWDPVYSAMQEGVTSISIGASSYCQEGRITRCAFAGEGSAARSTTWTASDGSTTVTIANNIGSQSAISVNQCEDLLIDGNYMGGSSSNCIVATFGNGTTNAEWRIVNNFFDGAGLHSAIIQLASVYDGSILNGLTISNNHFNGEFLSYQGISFVNSAGGSSVSPAVANFVISGNTVEALIGAFCTIYNATGGSITGNSITSYNVRNTSPGGDVNYCSAIWGGTHAVGISCVGNTLGGQNGSAATPSYCYQGIVGQFISERDTYWNGVGATGSQVGKKDKKVATATNANYQLTYTEDVVALLMTTTSAAVVPPTGVIPPQGFTFTMKDGQGTAGTYPMTFSAVVDGVTDPSYNTPFASITFMYYGTNWMVIGH